MKKRVTNQRASDQGNVASGDAEQEDWPPSLALPVTRLKKKRSIIEK